MTVSLTITAPIRLPAKTAGSLEGQSPHSSGAGIPTPSSMGQWESDARQAGCGVHEDGRDEKATIHGNRIRIRLLKGQSERAQKLIGFVHNSDSDPLLLLNMTCELLEVIGAEAGGREPRRAGDRWLVV